MRPRPSHDGRACDGLIPPPDSVTPMPRSTGSTDWKSWLESWDRQQESFNPEREHRFGTMMDVLQAKLGRRFRVLDLGSGPGSLSIRILRRFPAARAVAVDYDPVVRRIGEGALGTYGGRLTWVDAKLGAPGWAAALPRRQYDAVVSTTALHWLTSPQLARLYRDLGHLVRRGGVFLDGDVLPWGKRDRDLGRLSSRVMKIRSPGASGKIGWGDWRKWWRAARKVPGLRSAFEEHDRRESGHPFHRDMPDLDFHVRRLKAAGFRRVAVVWQDLENRVLFASR
jgi:SAM-dependent methyltransferase